MKDQIGSGSGGKSSSSSRSADRQNKALLVLNIIFRTIGNCGGPLIIRLYFLNGGHRVWLSSWLETGDWPIILLPLTYSYQSRRRRDSAAKLIQIDPFLFAASAGVGVGVLTGFDNYLYSYGVARLPVTTSALIIASQLVFNAGFAYLLVKHKFTAYSVNAVVLLTIGGAVLAHHTSGDRPKGESTREYVVAFVTTVVEAVLYGFVLPLMELVYKKAKQEITNSLVLEIQTVICFFATAFCTVGMIVHKDFQAIPREAKKFELGETKYYVVLVWSAIIWQGFFLVAIGVIFCASSLLSGIVISVLLSVTEILAVIFYQESFQAQKGVSLALSLWGFVSYFYGEYKHDKKNKKEHNPDQETEMPQIQNSPTTERYSLNP